MSINYGIVEFPNRIRRQKNFPLDEYSVFETLDLAKEYAATHPVAYNGQIISVIKNNQIYILSENKSFDETSTISLENPKFNLKIASGNSIINIGYWYIGYNDSNDLELTFNILLPVNNSNIVTSVNFNRINLETSETVNLISKSNENEFLLTENALIKKEDLESYKYVLHIELDINNNIIDVNMGSILQFVSEDFNSCYGTLISASESQNFDGSVDDSDTSNDDSNTSEDDNNNNNNNYNDNGNDKDPDNENSTTIIYTNEPTTKISIRDADNISHLIESELDGEYLDGGHSVTFSNLNGLYRLKLRALNDSGSNSDYAYLTISDNNVNLLAINNPYMIEFYSTGYVTISQYSISSPQCYIEEFVKINDSSALINDEVKYSDGLPKYIDLKEVTYCDSNAVAGSDISTNYISTYGKDYVLDIPLNKEYSINATIYGKCSIIINGIETGINTLINNSNNEYGYKSFSYNGVINSPVKIKFHNESQLFNITFNDFYYTDSYFYKYKNDLSTLSLPNNIACNKTFKSSQGNYTLTLCLNPHTMLALIKYNEDFAHSSRLDFNIEEELLKDTDFRNAYACINLFFNSLPVYVYTPTSYSNSVNFLLCNLKLTKLSDVSTNDKLFSITSPIQMNAGEIIDIRTPI